MFNKIMKKIYKNKLDEEGKRLEGVMNRIVDIFNEENLTVKEMGILLSSMNDGYRAKLKK